MKILSMSFYQQNAIDEVVIGIATANNKASKSSLLSIALRIEKALAPLPT